MHVPYKSLIGFVALAAAAFAVVHWRFADQPAPAPAVTSPVPVVTAQVQQHDEPIVLSGLGTVEALNMASIQSQVTGVLEEVDFTEGQTVKKGDVLAKIDPRLYQAALNAGARTIGQGHRPSCPSGIRSRALSKARDREFDRPAASCRPAVSGCAVRGRHGDRSGDDQ